MSPNAGELERARERAVRALGRRAMTRRGLGEWLRRRGFDDAVADRVIEDLARLRALDDREFAEHFVERRLGAFGADALVAELMARGVEDTIARAVVAEALAGREMGDDAAALARGRLKLTRGAPEAAARKVHAFLVRRGFDDETAQAAVERARAER